MDRGFFSTANVLGLNNKADKIEFIQPLPFSLKKAKELVNKYKKEISGTKSAFKYNPESVHKIYCFDIVHGNIQDNEQKKLFDKYPVKELLYELRKIKANYINNYDPIISETSKKQKLIFKAFQRSLPEKT